MVHRPAKVFGAAHFTLRCGRRLQDGTYQRPLVALACNFGHHILSLAQAGHPCELLTKCWGGVYASAASVHPLLTSHLVLALQKRYFMSGGMRSTPCYQEQSTNIYRLRRYRLLH